MAHENVVQRLRRVPGVEGAVLVPPMVAFYNSPSTVEEVIDHGVGRVLDMLGVEHSLYRRWEG